VTALNVVGLLSVVAMGLTGLEGVLDCTVLQLCYASFAPPFVLFLTLRAALLLAHFEIQQDLLSAEHARDFPGQNSAWKPNFFTRNRRFVTPAAVNQQRAAISIGSVCAGALFAVTAAATNPQSCSADQPWHAAASWWTFLHALLFALGFVLLAARLSRHGSDSFGLKHEYRLHTVSALLLLSVWGWAAFSLDDDNGARTVVFQMSAILTML
jgi:hypothetical protein